VLELCGVLDRRQRHSTHGLGRETRRVQADLDAWLVEYNESRPHQVCWCFGKTPMQTFLDALPMTKEKMIDAWITSDNNT